MVDLVVRHDILAPRQTAVHPSLNRNPRPTYVEHFAFADGIVKSHQVDPTAAAVSDCAAVDRNV